MGKSKDKRFDRKAMRKLAVNCVFAYDFVLEEQKNEAENAGKKETRPRPSPDSVVIKHVKDGKVRRTKISDEEYKKQLEEFLAEAEDSRESSGTQPPFDTEKFIQEVCEAQLDEDAEFVVFADLPDYKEYLYPVVSGVIENMAAINKVISENSIGWSVERMKKTDLAILRVAVFELLYFGSVVPLEVSINEAVELAKADEAKSGYFVNGVLSGIVKKSG